MRRVLCQQLPTPQRSVHLPEGEAVHATRVLRLRDGDTVEAIDGRGHAVTATLKVRGEIVHLEYEGPVEAAGGAFPITLEIAVLKGDAMEWVVEKAVELGVQKLIPTLTRHTVVQTHKKGPEVFRDRWQKIADQALKQCGRLEGMQIEAPIELEELLARQPSLPAEPRFWLDEASKSSAPPLAEALMARKGQGQEMLRQVRLLIGPEGGWNVLERELLSVSENVVPASLGPLILRAETAALAAVSLTAGLFLTSSR